MNHILALVFALIFAQSTWAVSKSKEIPKPVPAELPTEEEIASKEFKLPEFENVRAGDKHQFENKEGCDKDEAGFTIGSDGKSKTTSCRSNSASSATPSGTSRGDADWYRQEEEHRARSSGR